MSHAIVCNNCGDVLVLQANGDDENGESAGWLQVAVRDGEVWDACTRSCAVELLSDDGPVRPILDAHAEMVAEIARTVREGREDEQRP